MQNFQKQSADTRQEDELAIEILIWLSGEPDLFNRFLALTGLEADQLRAFSQSKGFTPATIGFIVGHEPTLMAFCQASHVAPETVSRLWQKFERNNGSSSQ